jgi:hypothetical protein
MFSKIIYKGPLDVLVSAVRAEAAIKTEYTLPTRTKENDPHYQDFVKEVQELGDVKTWKLFRLWWRVRATQKKWRGKPEKKHPAQMMQSMLMLEFMPDEIEVVVLAWMIHHGRFPSEDQRHKEITVELQRVMADSDTQKKVENVKANKRNRYNKRNEARRRSRMEKQNEVKNKGGRPKKSDGVRIKIMETLTGTSMTPSALCKELDLHASAVKSTLRRMVEVGEAVNNEGVYSLVVAKMS